MTFQFRFTPPPVENTSLCPLIALAHPGCPLTHKEYECSTLIESVGFRQGKFDSILIYYLKREAMKHLFRHLLILLISRPRLSRQIPGRCSIITLGHLSGCFCRKIFGLTESTSPVAISDLIPDNYVNEFAYGYDIFIDSRMKVKYTNNNLLSIHKLFIVIR